MQFKSDTIKEWAQHSTRFHQVLIVSASKNQNRSYSYAKT